jgi:hypothetical protein
LSQYHTLYDKTSYYFTLFARWYKTSSWYTWHLCFLCSQCLWSPFTFHSILRLNAFMRRTLYHKSRFTSLGPFLPLLVSFYRLWTLISILLKWPMKILPIFISLLLILAEVKVKSDGFRPKNWSLLIIAFIRHKGIIHEDNIVTKFISSEHHDTFYNSGNHLNICWHHLYSDLLKYVEYLMFTPVCPFVIPYLLLHNS